MRVQALWRDHQSWGRVSIVSHTMSLWVCESQTLEMICSPECVCVFSVCVYSVCVFSVCVFRVWLLWHNLYCIKRYTNKGWLCRNVGLRYANVSTCGVCVCVYSQFQECLSTSLMWHLSLAQDEIITITTTTTTLDDDDGDAQRSFSVCSSEESESGLMMELDMILRNNLEIPLVPLSTLALAL